MNQPTGPSGLDALHEGMASRRNFLIGGAMAAASGFAYVRRPKPVNPRVEKKQFESWVPTKVGPWTFVSASGVVLPPPDSLSNRLYDNLVSRVYDTADGSTVMIALAYNNIQNGVLQLHRPEICYPAGGFRLSPTREVPIRSAQRAIDANYFTAAGFERTEQVMYWTRVGNQFPTSWFDQRMAVVRANLEGVIPDGMLARFSVIGQDPDSALVTLQQFVLEFEKASAPQLRKLLVG
ncbi:MAG: EpsI family protein [Proteobacteria bacterium]|nr:EpsI family protein [Pseudomonadota bacterium]